MCKCKLNEERDHNGRRGTIDSMEDPKNNQEKGNIGIGILWWERDRDRQRKTDKRREKQRQRQREEDRHKKTDRRRQTEEDRQRKTDRRREKQRQRQREREANNVYGVYSIGNMIQ